MQSTLELFLSMMSAEKGSSQNTLNAYRSDLEQFLSFKNTAPENITATSVADFIQNLSSKGFAVKTLNRKLSAIRDFCKFLVEEKILSENENSTLLLDNSSNNIINNYIDDLDNSSPNRDVENDIFLLNFELMNLCETKKFRTY